MMTKQWLERAKMRLSRSLFSRGLSQKMHVSGVWSMVSIYSARQGAQSLSMELKIDYARYARKYAIRGKEVEPAAVHKGKQYLERDNAYCKCADRAQGHGKGRSCGQSGPFCQVFAVEHHRPKD